MPGMVGARGARRNPVLIRRTGAGNRGATETPTAWGVRMTYKPAPGTVAYRVIGWLETQGKAHEANTAQIAAALGVDPKAVMSGLEQSLAAGLVFRRQKDRTHPRAPVFWSLTNHGVRQRMEMSPNPVGWMTRPKDDEVPVFRERGTGETDTPQGDQAGSEPAREVMEPAVCESADGRGTNGAPALVTLPLHASPGVGPMGIGQPADAGPATDQRSGGHGTRSCADERSEGHGRYPAVAAPGQESGPLHHSATRQEETQPGRVEPAPPVASPPEAAQQAPGTARPGSESSAPPPDDARGKPAALPHELAELSRELQRTSRDALAMGLDLDAALDEAAKSVQAKRVTFDEQPREVDAQFAASLAAAMAYDDDALARGAELGRREDHLPSADLAATRRAVHAPRVGLVPHAFRAGRFSDGTLHLERDGAVIASLSAAEVDVLVQLLGARA